MNQWEDEKYGSKEPRWENKYYSVISKIVIICCILMCFPSSNIDVKSTHVTLLEHKPNIKVIIAKVFLFT